MIKCPPYISTSLTFTSKKPCKTPSSEEVNHQFYIYFCNPLPKRQRRGVVKAMCKFFVHCSSLVNICIFGIIDHKERTKVWVRKMAPDLPLVHWDNNSERLQQLSCLVSLRCLSLRRHSLPGRIKPFWCLYFSSAEFEGRIWNAEHFRNFFFIFLFPNEKNEIGN